MVIQRHAFLPRMDRHYNLNAITRDCYFCHCNQIFTHVASILGNAVIHPIERIPLCATYALFDCVVAWKVA
jgi:hypothetical protein